MHTKRPAPVIQQTCVRCCGTGRIRERGNRIICKACAGAGLINAVERARLLSNTSQSVARRTQKMRMVGDKYRTRGGRRPNPCVRP